VQQAQPDAWEVLQNNHGSKGGCHPVATGAPAARPGGQPRSASPRGGGAWPARFESH
jgi:hypothetical protein